MSIMREETFGPIIPVAKVINDNEAVRLMNDSNYGLTASVWTQDIDRGQQIADLLQAGTVFVNRCDYPSPVSSLHFWYTCNSKYHRNVHCGFCTNQTITRIGLGMDWLEDVRFRFYPWAPWFRFLLQVEKLPYQGKAGGEWVSPYLLKSMVVRDTPVDAISFCSELKIQPGSPASLFSKFACLF